LNILITGGAGFIGSHTADALIERGHRVRILDSLHPTVHPRGKPGYLNPACEFIQGDVRDKEAWRAGLARMDAVYHLAAYQDYLTDFSTFFHVNAVSTAMLYEMLVEGETEFPVQKVIVAASQAVMGEGRHRCPRCAGRDQTFLFPDIRLEDQMSRGEWDHRCPVCNHILDWLPSDETVIQPGNQYAVSKYTQEQIAIQLGKRYRIPTTVMRYSIVQGPRQSFHNAYSGAMRIFGLSLLLDRQPTIFEDGQQIRDYVNIGDVVRANLLVLEKEEADYEIFNVGGGRAWTVTEFYDTMQQVVGKTVPPIISGHYRYGDTRHIFSDVGKIKSLGWQPERSLEESIEAYWGYIAAQENIGNALEYSEDNMKRLNVIRKSGA